MKVLLVHNYYRNRLIGGEDVVFRKEEKALRERLGPENLIVYTASSNDLSFVKIALNVFFSFGHFRRIYKLIKSERPDVLHMHNYFPLLSFAPVIAAKFARVKTVITLHNYRLWCISGYLYRGNNICHRCLSTKLALPGIRNKCYHNSFLQSIITTLAVKIYKRFLTRVDQFWVLTEFQKNFLIEQNLLPMEKIRIKPNFMDSSGVYAPKNKEYDLIYVGKIEEQKGIHLIIEAFRDIKGYNLLVIGEGPLLEKYQAQKAEHITFLGKVDNDTTLSFVKKSRFLIQPSLWYETFALTIIEAFASGVPVLGFPIGTRLNLIQPDVNGLFIDQHDIATSLSKALSIDTEKYDTLVQGALSSSKAFEEKQVVQNQIDLYKKLSA